MSLPTNKQQCFLDYATTTKHNETCLWPPLRRSEPTLNVQWQKRRRRHTPFLEEGSLECTLYGTMQLGPCPSPSLKIIGSKQKSRSTVSRASVTKAILRKMRLLRLTHNISESRSRRWSSHRHRLYHKV